MWEAPQGSKQTSPIPWPNFFYSVFAAAAAKSL